MNTEIEKIVKQIIKKSINPDLSMDGIHGDDDLEKLGMTSRNFLKVVVGLETEWDFEFDDEFLNYHKLKTIKSISTYIESKIS